MVSEVMTVEKPPKVLTAGEKQKVSYCIPLWLRDEQIRLNTARVKGRIAPHPVRTEPIAVACFGPSLSETWEEIRAFKFIISCSGAHKFLIERGIIPTWHTEVDPRIHKMALVGDPHKDVEYLIASTCHPDYVQHLERAGVSLKLWHIFDAEDEARRVLPPGEWALTGGCSVGLRALALARFLGFTNLHVFGMDGSEGKTGKHAAEHPNQAKQSAVTVYDGVEYRTTPGFLEAAQQTWHELDDLPDVTATFHGEGLVQAMAKHYVRKPRVNAGMIGFNKPELISEAYREQNVLLHESNLAYGVGAGRHASAVKKLIATLKTSDGLPPSVLDYGAGKGYLQKALPFPIYEYDPAIPGKQESPRAADLVCCLDVLEHIEPDKLLFVLDDLRRCVKQIGYFAINTGPAGKTLPDGRNTHLIQEGRTWWEAKLERFFNVAKVWENGKGRELIVLVSPRQKKSPDPLAPEPAVMAFRFGTLVVRRSQPNGCDPYVIGGASDVLDPTTYARLCESFPTDVPYAKFGSGDVKQSLSERNNPAVYLAFISRSEPWQAFHAYIKSAEFLEKMRRILKAQKMAVLPPSDQLRTRFEFSMLPANGGLLRPHTDIPSKLVTLVVSMRRPSDVWEDAWGGGTDVLAIKQETLDANLSVHDYTTPREQFDTLHTYPYRPNAAVLFVKSNSSWHSVGPLSGPEGYWRKTVTINIERVE